METTGAMATGYLDNGEPVLEIAVKGALSNVPQQLTCLVDTGFTGFLSIPLVEALPLGLVLSGTTSVTFANGATEYRLTCLGVVEVDALSEAGVIILEMQGNRAILGMDFLRIFGLELRVEPTSGLVELAPPAASAPGTPNIP